LGVILKSSSAHCILQNPDMLSNMFFGHLESINSFASFGAVFCNSFLGGGALSVGLLFSCPCNINGLLLVPYFLPPLLLAALSLDECVERLEKEDTDPLLGF